MLTSGALSNHKTEHLQEKWPLVTITVFMVSEHSNLQVSILNSDYIKTAVLNIDLRCHTFYIRECNTEDYKDHCLIYIP